MKQAVPIAGFGSGSGSGWGYRVTILAATGGPITITRAEPLPDGGVLMSTLHYRVLPPLSPPEFEAVVEVGQSVRIDLAMVDPEFPVEVSVDGDKAKHGTIERDGDAVVYRATSAGEDAIPYDARRVLPPPRPRVV